MPVFAACSTETVEWSLGTRLDESLGLWLHNFGAVEPVLIANNLLFTNANYLGNSQNIRMHLCIKQYAHTYTHTQ